MTERLDPEQPKPLHQIWRKLHCNMYCRYDDWDKTKWMYDIGYCLDRYSLIDGRDARYD